MKLKATQKSYVPTEKDLAKKWVLVDVKGKLLGPTAAEIADLLRGKKKTFFSKQFDCGDYVVAINAKEIKLAGKKMDTKLYQWHTQYPGGLRERTAKQVLEQKPEQLLYDAVWGMLPRNKSRKHIIKKLRIFPGPEHNHKAQL